MNRRNRSATGQIRSAETASALTAIDLLDGPFPEPDRIVYPTIGAGAGTEPKAVPQACESVEFNRGTGFAQC